MTVSTRPRMARDQLKSLIAVGAYLTDGHRLVEVTAVEPTRVICEEGSVEYPTLVSISLSEVAADWRVVEVPDEA